MYEKNFWQINEEMQPQSNFKRIFKAKNGGLSTSIKNSKLCLNLIMMKNSPKSEIHHIVMS